MATIGEILVNLKAELATFNSQMTDARQSISKIGDAATATRSDVSALSGVMQGAATVVEGFVAAFSVREIKEFISAQLDATSKIGETARAIGIGVEAYQQLQFAATQVGVEHEALDKALAIFAKNIGLASLGSEKANAGFKALGINVRDAQGNVRPLADLFDQVSTKLGGLGDSSQRAGLASEFFGKGFASIGPLLAEGGRAIDELKARALELGVVLTDKDIEAAKKTKDEFQALGDILGSDFKKAVVGLSPVLLDFAHLMEGVEAAGRRFLDWASKVPEAVTTANMDAGIEKTRKLIDDYSAQLVTLEGRRTKDASLTNAWIATQEAFIKSQLTGAKELYEQMLEARAAVDKPAGGGDTTKPSAIAEPLNKERQKEVVNYKRAYDDLISSLHAGTAEQNALRAAYAQGSLAVDRARVATAGYAAVQKVLNDAAKDHVQVSARELQIAQDAAEQKERATIDAADDKAVHDALSTATEAYNVTLQAERDRVFELIDPTKKLRDEQALLADVYQRGMISADQYSKGQLAVIAASKNEMKGTTEIVSAIRTGASQFLDQLVKIGQTGDPIEALGNAFIGLAQDIEKVVVEMLVLDPLMKSLKESINSSGGIGGFFGGGNGPAVDAGEWDVPAATAAVAASANGAMASRSASAPGSSSAMQVIINNNSGSKVGVSQGSDGSGGKSLLIQIDEAMANGIATGRSSTATALQRTGIGGLRAPVAR